LIAILENENALHNPPLEMGETGKISSLPFARGGLGWGNLRNNGDSITCVYTVAFFTRK
jgi:hypothetical protein